MIRRCRYNPAFRRVPRQGLRSFSVIPMDPQSGQSEHSSRSWRLPPLAIAALSILFVHVGVLAFFGQQHFVGIWSDFLQLATALVASAACLVASRRARGIAHPFWYLTGAALAIWSLGKAIVIYDFDFLGMNQMPIVPLLIFFLAVAPMFVTVFLSDENFRNTINWEWVLDGSQILGLILVLYLFLVYVPVLYYGDKALNSMEDRLLLWRNILLAAGLLGRALLSHSTSIRRLYLPVGLIMTAYAVTTWFGNRAQSLSDAPENWYDLAWAVPFGCIAITAAYWPELPEEAISPQPSPGISRVVFAYLPSLLLPVLLMLKYREVVREQIFLGLFGLIFSIVLFNLRLVLTQRRQRLTHEALQATEQQYRSLFERNMAGVFRCTFEGRLLDCNPAYANMFGYTREELLSIPLHELYFGGAEERNQWIRTLSSEGPARPREFCLRRKDGMPFWILLNANLEKQADGTVLLEGTVVDITERRALESQLRQAQKMEAVGRLAGGVAHDFNNLLTIISGYSTIILERTGAKGPFHHEAEQIKSAADRAASLTRQLLAFSRQQVLQPRNVNLNEVVRSLDKMLRRLIGEDIEVMTVLSADLGTVKVDPGQMDQVLMNLVVNARDAMPNGGKLTIQTENVLLDGSYVKQHEYTTAGQYVSLAVSDNGTGIDPDTQARIFEPFFTTKEPGKGTGLGLPMVYGIVKQSGGSIEVYSEVNQGTTVKIYLPRLDAPVDVLVSPAKAAAIEKGSARILLVEDDAMLRRMAADILASHGYSVHPVENLEDIGTVLDRTAKCDLLLTDVVMPNMKGPELAQRVAQRWPGVRVLFMSGYTTNAIVHHGVLEKGLFFLQKPFTPSALAAKVREVLNAPAARQAKT